MRKLATGLSLCVLALSGGCQSSRPPVASEAFSSSQQPMMAYDPLGKALFLQDERFAQASPVTQPERAVAAGDVRD